MLSEGALGAMNIKCPHMPPAGGAAVRGGAAQVRDAGPQQHEVLGHHRALHVQDGGEAVGHGPAERDRVRKALFSTVNADFVKQLACGKAEQERCDG